MASLVLESADSVLTHPTCPLCAVAMSLTKVERRIPHDLKLTRHHYECAACGGKAIIPPLDDF